MASPLRDARPRSAGAPSPCPVFENEILVLGGDDGKLAGKVEAAKHPGYAEDGAPRYDKSTDTLDGSRGGLGERALERAPTEVVRRLRRLTNGELRPFVRSAEGLAPAGANNHSGRAGRRGRATTAPPRRHAPPHPIDPRGSPLLRVIPPMGLNDSARRTAWLIVALLVPVALLNYLDRQMLASMKLSMVTELPDITTKARWASRSPRSNGPTRSAARSADISRTGPADVTSSA
jgi:hypothetical protein